MALRDGAAVVAALGTYRGLVLPPVRRQLREWRQVAAAIPDPARRRPALEAIDAKGLNVEATAVFATLAPRRNRAGALRAMVALQVAIDYLDSVDELGIEGDRDYLERLFDAYRAATRSLPAHAAVAVSLQRAIDRCGEGQRHTHLAERGDRAALERWARAEEAAEVYRWWEVAAGASSSVAAHALIAAAADPGTSGAEAELIDAAYFPAIGALTVLLDDLIDRDEDAAAGAHNYIAYYRDSADAADRLELIVHLAEAGLALLRRRRRHAAILAGVSGFYLSAPAAATPYALPIRDRLLDAAGPAVRPIVAFMRSRR